MENNYLAPDRNDMFNSVQGKQTLNTSVTMERYGLRLCFPLWLFVFLLVICYPSAGFPSLWQSSQCEWIQPLHPSQRPVVHLPNARNVVVFTDGTNFDDVVALLFLTKSKLCNVIAIYITGNGWASPGASIRHFFNILTLMGSRYASVPIFVGSYYALKAGVDDTHKKMGYRSYIPFGPGGILYSDVLYGMAQFLPQGRNAYDIRKTPDTDETSIPALLEHLDRTKPLEKITFLSIGTLTPFALMFSKKQFDNIRSLLRRVDGLYIMGGAVDVKGNIFSSTTNDKAEFNIFADPDGAELAFLDMSKYMDVTLVPLDAIRDVPFTESIVSELFRKPKTPEAQLVGHLMKNLKDSWFMPHAFFQTAFLWDPSAAIAMLHSGVVSSRKKQMIRVVVEEGVDGPDQGWTKPCTAGEVLHGTCAEMDVVEGLDGELLRGVLVETLQQKENSAELPLVCLDK